MNYFLQLCVNIESFTRGEWNFRILEGRSVKKGEVKISKRGVEIKVEKPRFFGKNKEERFKK